MPPVRGCSIRNYSAGLLLCYQMMMAVLLSAQMRQTRRVLVWVIPKRSEAQRCPYICYFFDRSALALEPHLPFTFFLVLKYVSTTLKIPFLFISLR